MHFERIVIIVCLVTLGCLVDETRTFAGFSQEKLIPTPHSDTDAGRLGMGAGSSTSGRRPRPLAALWEWRVGQAAREAAARMPATEQDVVARRRQGGA